MIEALHMIEVVFFCTYAAAGTAPIDRSAVVKRHTVTFAHNSTPDPKQTAFNALTVGNGDFAFTADLTGLQTFNDSYPGRSSFPLLTLSNWGWHSPDPATLGAPPVLHKDGSLNYVYEVSKDLNALGRVILFHFDAYIMRT